MNKLKVLMVDDESRMRKLVNDFLSRKNYEVIEAGDGEEAIDKFYADKDIALVILDVMMPKMDGWEVCKQDQDRRYHGLDKNDQCLIRNHLGYKRLQYDCHLKTINDQRNIISYQHGRDKQIWITIENTQYLTG